MIWFASKYPDVGYLWADWLVAFKVHTGIINTNLTNLDHIMSTNQSLLLRFIHTVIFLGESHSLNYTH